MNVMHKLKVWPGSMALMGKIYCKCSPCMVAVTIHRLTYIVLPLVGDVDGDYMEQERGLE